MKKGTKAERRQYPRIEKQLPFQVEANGYDFSTTTRNISCLGAYCHIDRYMPPFTKVMIRLDLPVATPNGNTQYSVRCKGIIVRSEDESQGFNIAIFFNEIKDNEKQKISRYISQFLPQNSSSQ